MSPTIKALLVELAPVLDALVERTVAEHVARELGAQGTPGSFRGKWVAGVAFGVGHVVAHGGALYRAVNPTTKVPGIGAADWRLVADADRGAGSAA